MPGSARSAPKLARPVTFSMPSGRMGRVPTTFRSPFLNPDAIAGSLLLKLGVEPIVIFDEIYRQHPSVGDEIPGSKAHKVDLTKAQILGSMLDSGQGRRRATHVATARLTLRVDLGEDRAVGPGKIRLLEAIRDTGSITKAGIALGMSYRRAWLLVDDMNNCFREPVVAAQAG